MAACSIVHTTAFIQLNSSLTAFTLTSRAGSSDNGRFLSSDSEAYARHLHQFLSLPRLPFFPYSTYSPFAFSSTWLFPCPTSIWPRKELPSSRANQSVSHHHIALPL
nr:hypothetical protein I308_04843 [Cryptococcus tetragattii IND107]